MPRKRAGGRAAVVLFFLSFGCASAGAQSTESPQAQSKKRAVECPGVNAIGGKLAVVTSSSLLGQDKPWSSWGKPAGARAGLVAHASADRAWSSGNESHCSTLFQHGCGNGRILFRPQLWRNTGRLLICCVERAVRWDDACFEIRWPEPVQVISEKDKTCRIM